MIEAEVMRYSDPEGFAREVNLPLLGMGSVPPVRSGATITELLAVSAGPELARVVDGLDETRRSLTLRSLLLAGFPDDAEVFGIGLAVAREWGRRGRKVAVIDLDFWNPTVLRPLPHSNEGLVDALEYGCSFRRIAWEIVSGSLWVIGPGSYPPDPQRLTEHSDWDRLGRGFGAHVDVSLYVAPLLNRSGFVGKLSKRMDGVVLAACVERVGRSDLRDAFLELWGSDAPMIGCVGIEPTEAAEQSGRYPSSEGQAPITEGSLREGVLDGLIGVPSAAPHRPEVGDAREEELIGVAPRSEARAESHDSVTDLTEVLEREVRLGRSTVKPIRRSRSRLYAALGVAFSVLAVILTFVARKPSLEGAKEALPTGMEPMQPAPEQPLSSGTGQTVSPLPADGALQSATGAPAAKPEPSVAPSPPPSASAPADRPFRVHVASFKSEAKVREIVGALKARGEDAWYERAEGAPYYRVFVGRYATEEEARTHAQWLLDHHLVDRATPYPQTER